jgi:hypothetical protein
MISFLRDINPDNIVLNKKQCHSSNLSFYPLSYNLNKKKSPFIVQINDLYSKFGVNTFQNNHNKNSNQYIKKSIDLSISDDLLDVCAIFTDIKNTLENKLKKPIIFPVRESKYGKFIRCKIHDLTKIYSSNEELISIDNIKSHLFCDCIIQIKGLWYMKDDSGSKVWFDLNILQVRLDTPVFLKDYAFIDSKKPDSPKKKQPDKNIPEKYQKMLAMGIPKAAVDFRMEMDGVETKTESKSKSKSTTNNNKNKNINQMSLNDMLKNNFTSIGNPMSKLKKTTIVKKSPDKYRKTGNNAPSLDEITQALKFLKKIS